MVAQAVSEGGQPTSNQSRLADRELDKKVKQGFLNAWQNNEEGQILFGSKLDSA